MSEPAIPAQEIVTIFRACLCGEIKPLLRETRSWGDFYAGDMRYDIGGYRVVIFNDCLELDYVDHAIAPDGRKTQFEEWADTDGDPTWLLDAYEHAALERLLEDAEPEPLADESPSPIRPPGASR